MSSSNPSADDGCALCGTQRDMHGDSNHEFNLDGQLIPRKPGPAPRQEAPKERGASISAPAQSIANDMVAQMLLRMVERLIARGILNDEDLVYMFGGEHATSTGRATREGARTDIKTTSPE